MLGLSASAAAAAVAVPLIASSAPSDYNLPDLVSVAPPAERSYLVEGAFTGAGFDPNEWGTRDTTGPRLLLRFDGYIDNLGDGPVEFKGNPQKDGLAGGVQQYVQRKGDNAMIAASNEGVVSPVGYERNNNAELVDKCIGLVNNSLTEKPNTGPCVIFSSTDQVPRSDGHNHWHLVNAARYSLWNKEGTAQVAPGQKVGFCLYDYSISELWTKPRDTQWYGQQVSGSDNFCQAYNAEKPESTGRNATNLLEGIRPGYRDVYGSYLAWQWLDVTDVQPGLYRLGDEVDPSNRIWEKTGTEKNGVALSETITIPGFVASAPDKVTTAVRTAVTIPLSSTTYGGTCFKAGTDEAACARYTPKDSDRRYKVLTAPSKGTLNVAAGQPFTASSLVYTPGASMTGGVDTFTVTAYDQTSAYPRNPTGVTVQVVVGNGAPAAVAISGNPASLVVGTSAQLSASVANTTGGVTWSVNGVGGGNATLGTVSATGLYTAPAAVPSAGQVTVRATSVSEPSVYAETVIKVTKAADIGAQPIPVGTSSSGAGTTGSKKAPLVARIGGRVVLKYAPFASGRLTMTVKRGKKLVGRCTFPKAVKGRTVVCQIPARKTLTNIKVITTLKASATGKTTQIVLSKKRI